MARKLSALAMLLALSACATFSTAPEAANVRVRQLCYVLREPQWVQIAPPHDSQAYREAWAQAADGRGYVTPQWPEDEFWFRNAEGVTKLCTGNPFYREERCSAGTTVDFTQGDEGLTASSFQEPICIL